MPWNDGISDGLIIALICIFKPWNDDIIGWYIVALIYISKPWFDGIIGGGHPEYIVFLCCDAFGTLPIAKFLLLFLIYFVHYKICLCFCFRTFLNF